jgi:hypothetical protein
MIIKFSNFSIHSGLVGISHVLTSISYQNPDGTIVIVPVPAPIALANTQEVVNFLKSYCKGKVAVTYIGNSFSIVIKKCFYKLTSISIEYLSTLSGIPTTETDDFNFTLDSFSYGYDPNIVRGCLDSESENYNSLATESDGSCIAPAVANYDILSRRLNAYHKRMLLTELNGEKLCCCDSIKSRYMLFVVNKAKAVFGENYLIQEEVRARTTINFTTIDVDLFDNIVQFQLVQYNLDGSEQIIATVEGNFTGMSIEEFIVELCRQINLGSNDYLILPNIPSLGYATIYAPPGNGDSYNNVRIRFIQSNAYQILEEIFVYDADAIINKPVISSVDAKVISINSPDNTLDNARKNYFSRVNEIDAAQRIDYQGQFKPFPQLPVVVDPSVYNEIVFAPCDFGHKGYTTDFINQLTGFGAAGYAKASLNSEIGLVGHMSNLLFDIRVDVSLDYYIMVFDTAASGTLVDSYKLANPHFNYILINHATNQIFCFSISSSEFTIVDYRSRGVWLNEIAVNSGITMDNTKHGRPLFYQHIDLFNVVVWHIVYPTSGKFLEISDSSGTFNVYPMYLDKDLYALTKSGEGLDLIEVISAVSLYETTDRIELFEPNLWTTPQSTSTFVGANAFQGYSVFSNAVNESDIAGVFYYACADGKIVRYKYYTGNDFKVKTLNIERIGGVLIGLVNSGNGIMSAIVYVDGSFPYHMMYNIECGENNYKGAGNLLPVMTIPVNFKVQSFFDINAFLLSSVVFDETMYLYSDSNRLYFIAKYYDYTAPEYCNGQIWAYSRALSNIHVFYYDPANPDFAVKSPFALQASASGDEVMSAIALHNGHIYVGNDGPTLENLTEINIINFTGSWSNNFNEYDYTPTGAIRCSKIVGNGSVVNLDGSLFIIGLNDSDLQILSCIPNKNVTTDRFTSVADVSLLDVCKSDEENHFYVITAEGKIIHKQVEYGIPAFLDRAILDIPNFVDTLVPKLYYDAFNNFLVVVITDNTADPITYQGVYFIDLDQSIIKSYLEIIAEDPLLEIKISDIVSTQKDEYYLTYIIESIDETGYLRIGLGPGTASTLLSTFVEGQNEITQNEEDLCLTFEEINKLVENSTQLLLTC